MACRTSRPSTEIGPVDAQGAEGQDWKDRKNAVETAKDEAYALIQATRRYTYNAWFRDTADTIKLKYQRGLGDGTFSTAVKAMVIDSWVLDLGDHYQVVSQDEAGTSPGGIQAAAKSTSNFRLPPHRGRKCRKWKWSLRLRTSEVPEVVREKVATVRKRLRLRRRPAT